MSQQPLVIYHGGCVDGQGAATAFYSKYPNAEFFAATYGKPMPGVKGRDVYMLDFSYPRAQVESMCAEAESVTIIDHHRSAMLDLEPLKLPNLNKIFVMEHSGAVLAWKWAWPNIKVPQLLRHIEDRDLWRFNLEHTKPVNAYLYSIDFDFTHWSSMLTDQVFYASLDAILIQGRALIRQDDKRVAQIVKHARMVQIGGHLVPCVNCNHYFASDVGHVLAKDHPFSASYYDTNDGRVFSLRSAEGCIDVSVIAKHLGGGGHASAAGFRVTFDEARAFEIAP